MVTTFEPPVDEWLDEYMEDRVSGGDQFPDPEYDSWEGYDCEEEEVEKFTVNDLIREASLKIRLNPTWRWGQTLSNVLYENRPELANAIRGTDLDPFYNDHVVESFLKFVEYRLLDGNY